MNLATKRVSKLGLVALAVVTSACASTGATPRPFPMPSGRHPAPGPYDTYALVGTALALRGAPYRNGGSDPKGFDCSGFTQYVFAQHGIGLPREVREQFRSGDSVAPADLAPGDLVFFATSGPTARAVESASHVAIVVGGDEFVHAPSSTGVVRVERLSTQYWAQRFVGARRYSREIEN